VPDVVKPQSTTIKACLLIAAGVLFLPKTLPANSFICTVSTATGPLPSAACGTGLSGNSTAFDWSSLNPQQLGPMSGPTYQSSSNPHTGTAPWTGTSAGETVAVAMEDPPGSSPYLQLDGNTAWVYAPSEPISQMWDGYIPASYLDTSVQLGFPTINPANPIPWYFGETVLTENNTGTSGDVPIDITFSQAVNAVGFQISTLSSPNFMATLMAYDAKGNFLGSVVLNGDGGGGPCTMMANSPPGTPCSNTSPFISISDDQLHLASNLIKSIKVYTTNGDFALGTLYFEEAPLTSTAPEPSAALLVLAGLGAVVYRRRRS